MESQRCSFLLQMWISVTQRTQGDTFQLTRNLISLGESIELDDGKETKYGLSHAQVAQMDSPRSFQGQSVSPNFHRLLEEMIIANLFQS